MSNKVVICGLDTSTLPRVTAKEMQDVLKKYKHGDKSQKDLLIMYNLRLVLSIVQRFDIKEHNIDDVFQVGIIGLIKSIDNFDINIGVRFSTYAVPMIIGEIKRFLRDNTSLKITRSLRDIAYKALQAKQSLSFNSNDDPRLEDIASAIDVPLKDVACAMEAICEPVSIYETVFLGNDDSIEIIDQLKDSVMEDNWIEKSVLYDAINHLDSREKEILIKRYFIGKTQMEISNEIGISQAQVSRLEKTALSLIKEMI